MKVFNKSHRASQRRHPKEAELNAHTHSTHTNTHSLSRRLDEAVQVFNKSLTEHRNADTLKKLNNMRTHSTHTYTHSLSLRLDEAVQVFNKSLTEHRNADTLKKLNDTEKIIKERKEQAYIDMDLSNVEKVRVLMFRVWLFLRVWLGAAEAAAEAQAQAAWCCETGRGQGVPVHDQ